MDILERKVTLLDPLSCSVAILSSTHEYFGCGRHIHSSRASLWLRMINSEHKVTWTKVLGLLSDFIAHFGVCRSLVTRSAFTAFLLVTTLLESSQRLVVALCAIVANLDLVDVRGTLFGNSVLHCFGAWQFVWWIWALSSFKLIALLKAHLEVVLPLRGYLQVHRALIVDILSWLRHTALMLRYVVILVGSQRKIGLCTSVAVEYLICIFFALYDSLHVFFFGLLWLAKTFLCRALREVKVRSGQVWLTKLVDKRQAFSLGLRVKRSSMILEVVSVLRKSIEGVCVSQLEVILLKVVLHDSLLRVPFLAIHFLLNTICLTCFSLCPIAKLKVGWLNLLSFHQTSLFGNILTDFFGLLMRLSRVVGILLPLSVNLTVSTGP